MAGRAFVVRPTRELALIADRVGASLSSAWRRFPPHALSRSSATFSRNVEADRRASSFRAVRSRHRGSSRTNIFMRALEEQRVTSPETRVKRALSRPDAPGRLLPRSAPPSAGSRQSHTRRICYLGPGPVPCCSSWGEALLGIRTAVPAQSWRFKHVQLVGAG